MSIISLFSEFVLAKFTSRERNVFVLFSVLYVMCKCLISEFCFLMSFRNGVSIISFFFFFCEFVLVKFTSRERNVCVFFSVLYVMCVCLISETSFFMSLWYRVSIISCTDFQEM